MNSDTAQLLGRLINIGMNEREAKVYLALVYSKNATAAELQIPSGVPRTKIYETLKSLIQKGFCCERKIGNVRSFAAVTPKSALARSIRDLEARLDDANQLTEELDSILTLSGDYSEPIEYIETFYGKDYIHRRYIQLIRGAKEDILGFGRPPYTFAKRELAEEQIHEFYRFHERHGISRWVYEFNYPEEEWIIPGLIKGQEMGASFRVAERLPMKMVIFDRREVLITQKAPPTIPDEVTNALIKNGAIAAAFHALFEFFWNQSTDLNKWLEKNRK